MYTIDHLRYKKKLRILNICTDASMCDIAYTYVCIYRMSYRYKSLACLRINEEIAFIAYFAA